MNSDFIIGTTDSFDKSVNKLLKKYPSIPSDLRELKTQLLANPADGTSLGKSCYKVRMNIASKKKGKSGGARVITYLKIQDKQITLLDIYDKAEKDTITDKELTALLKKAD
jgi:hypothetical protein